MKKKECIQVTRKRTLKHTAASSACMVAGCIAFRTNEAELPLPSATACDVQTAFTGASGIPASFASMRTIPRGSQEDQDIHAAYR